MLWLDLQGAELLALNSSPKILNTVSVILTEVEFVEAYTNQAQFKEFTKWLRTKGFKLVGINHSNIWFGDALFVRDNQQQKQVELF